MVNRIALLLEELGAIERGDFVLASGARSSWYVDIKSACTHPGLLQAIGEEITERTEFEVVAGVALGAVPIAVAVSLAARKPYAIIRKEEKKHGIVGTIIGEVAGREVLLVEDVTTSGGSVIFGIERLREAGAFVLGVVTVVDREAGCAEKLRELDIPFLPLVRASEIRTE